ncbi:hypothetical protein C8R48DRAFT_833942 [Suillus tomentosus]|nr:hypothetical protein C8R48DRAFT_833942 [Suillus tomentosus]
MGVHHIQLDIMPQGERYHTLLGLTDSGDVEFSRSHTGQSDGSSDSSAPEDIVLDAAAGYAEGDHSISTRQQMKLDALIHVLNKKQFLSSWVGPKYIADDKLIILVSTLSLSSSG